MVKFKVADDFDIYQNPEFEFDRGVTCLVGKNGSGKSTLLRCIKQQLVKACKPVMSYDNYSQGGDSAKSKYGFQGKVELLATAVCSSEGEQIIINCGHVMVDIGNFIRGALKDGHTEIYVLLDALDSGLSINNIRRIKGIFELMLNEDPDADIYIIVAANTYELVKDAECVAVRTAEKLQFSDYEDYANFVCSVEVLL